MLESVLIPQTVSPFSEIAITDKLFAIVNGDSCLESSSS